MFCATKCRDGQNRNSPVTISAESKLAAIRGPCGTAIAGIAAELDRLVGSNCRHVNTRVACTIALTKSHQVPVRGKSRSRLETSQTNQGHNFDFGQLLVSVGTIHRPNGNYTN